MTVCWQADWKGTERQVARRVRVSERPSAPFASRVTAPPGSGGKERPFKACAKGKALRGRRQGRCTCVAGVRAEAHEQDKAGRAPARTQTAVWPGPGANEKKRKVGLHVRGHTGTRAVTRETSPGRGAEIKEVLTRGSGRSPRTCFECPCQLSVAQKCASSMSCENARASLMPEMASIYDIDEVWGVENNGQPLTMH